MAHWVTVGLAVALLSVPVPARAQSDDPEDQFAGADRCATCHQAIGAAWAKTKHARAIEVLRGNDRTNKTCLACHITATPEMMDKEVTNPHFPNVQCEACHGAGNAHATQAAAGSPALAGMLKEPGEKVCVACHNARSPSYKGFFYTGMKSLVHRP